MSWPYRFESFAGQSLHRVIPIAFLLLTNVATAQQPAFCATAFKICRNFNFAILVDYPGGIMTPTRSRPPAVIYEPDTENSPSAASKAARVPAAEEMKPNSLVYLETKLNKWHYVDAIKVLGEPFRHRDGVPRYPSDIYAFEDPTELFREVELDFDKKKAGLLVNIYAYPWMMTWDECKGIWGADVKTAKQPNGKKLYMYKNNRINVVVNNRGAVESIGVY